TVAAALQANGQWDFDTPRNLDAEDWWYRTTFDAADLSADQPCHLCLDGLATLAEVWLNGRRLLIADNMFRAYRVNIAPYLRLRNELVLAFRSLAEELKRKRPRPRWKTNLVNHQQLRWFRSSLLGRLPGWSPPVPVVGPWRTVRLDTQPFALSDLRLTSRIENEDGIVTLYSRIHSTPSITRAILQVDERELTLDVKEDADGWLLHGELRLPDPPLWWPHTHGEQSLSECSLHLHAGTQRYTVPCGKIGFRQLDVSQDD